MTVAEKVSGRDYVQVKGTGYDKITADFYTGTVPSYVVTYSEKAAAATDRFLADNYTALRTGNVRTTYDVAPSTEFSAGKVGVAGDRVIFVTDAKDKEVLYIINVDESVYTKDKKDVVVDALDALWTLINADQGVTPAGSKVAQATEALEAYDTLAEIPDADAKDAAQALVTGYTTGDNKLTTADAEDAQEWVDYQDALDAVQAAIAAFDLRATKKAGYQSLIDANKAGWPEGAAEAAEKALDEYLLTLTAAEIAALTPDYDNVWNTVIAPVVQALQKAEALENAEAVIGDKTYTTLAAALAAAQSGETVTLTDDVTLTDQITIGEGVTLDGAGNTITAEGPYNVGGSGSHAAILVQASGVTIKNLTVVGPNTRTNQWDEGEYGIQIFGDSAGATLDTVTVTGANTGIGVFSCTVTLEGTIDVSGNEFGGILVDQGTSNTNAGKLIIKGTLKNDTEKAYVPTIWCETAEKGSLEKGAQTLYRYDYKKSDTVTQLTYYLDSANVPVPSAT